MDNVFLVDLKRQLNRIRNGGGAKDVTGFEIVAQIDNDYKTFRSSKKMILSDLDMILNFLEVSIETKEPVTLEHLRRIQCTLKSHQDTIRQDFFPY